jgi:aryl-alcohol dehydrogenase-like predicted oxidoreductase
METVAFGTTDLRVTRLGMGCAKLGAFWQGRSLRDGARTLAAAYDQGIRLFDTADCYARGISERLVGRTLRNRDDAVIVTKVGLLKTPAAWLSAARARALASGVEAAFAQPRDGSRCFTPRYVEQAVERSLRRLGREALDVLLLHGPPLPDLQAQTFMLAVDRLIQSGKVRYYGASAATPQSAVLAAELPGASCIQLPYNPRRPEVVTAVAEPIRRTGIAVTTTSPLGDGAMLAAAATARVPRDRIVAACLHHSMARPEVTSVLVGMSRPQHVAANIGALQLVPDESLVNRLAQGTP